MENCKINLNANQKYIIKNQILVKFSQRSYGKSLSIIIDGRNATIESAGYPSDRYLAIYGQPRRSTFSISLKNMLITGFFNRFVNGSALSFEGADSVILENVRFVGNTGLFGGPVYISARNHTDSPTSAPSSSFPSAAPSLSVSRPPSASSPSVSSPSVSSPSALVPSTPTTYSSSLRNYYTCDEYNPSYGSKYCPFISGEIVPITVCPGENTTIDSCGRCTGKQRIQIAYLKADGNVSAPVANLTGGCGSATSDCVYGHFVHPAGSSGTSCIDYVMMQSCAGNSTCYSYGLKVTVSSEFSLLESQIPLS